MITGVVNRNDVCRLTKFCASSYIKYCTYKVLFEGSDRHRRDYGRIAPFTLEDIATALKEHVILQVCKLADPLGDHRGNENLSIQFFIEHSDVGDQSIRLKSAGNRLAKFGTKLKPARDKIISHFDRKTTYDGEPLGGAPDNEWERYWNDLKEFVDILALAYFKHTASIRSATATMDAAILRGVLERAAKSNLPLSLPTSPPEVD